MCTSHRRHSRDALIWASDRPPPAPAPASLSALRRTHGAHEQLRAGVRAAGTLLLYVLWMKV